MKGLGIVFWWLLITFGYCYGQTNQTPVTSPARRSSDDQQRESSRMSRNADSAFKDLHNNDIPQTFQKTPIEIMALYIQPLYRKPGKKDLKDLIPSQNLLAQYDQFLKQENTGIFKLSADNSCAKNNSVVAATESCASNTIPGGGTAFSFRVNTHRILHLADLTLEKDILKTDGVMQQGMMVSLGDIELDKVTPETAGLKFLMDFKPALTKKELQKNDQELSAGIKADGFIYRFGFYVDNNSTFALRSIAYRGKIIRSIKGVNYNEMDYDKRKDVLVVFRIIEKDQNGDITVLWKELVRKDSPELKEN